MNKYPSDEHVQDRRDRLSTLQCPDCDGPMVLRNSRYGLFYGCKQYPDCTATHGAHPNGQPLGIPANRETKQARKEAHKAFDRLWKDEDAIFDRDGAYEWLQEELGLDSEACHIGKFDKETCQKVIEVCQSTSQRSRPPRVEQLTLVDITDNLERLDSYRET